MAYYQHLLVFFVSLWILLMTFWFYHDYRHKKLLEKISSMPFPENYRNFLTGLAHYNKLSSYEKTKIEASILRFIYTKTFIGVKGLEVNDEMKGSYCLPCLSTPTAYRDGELL